MLTLLITTIIFLIAGFNLASSSKHKKLQIYLSITVTMGFYIYSYIKIGLSNPGIASSHKDLNE